MRRWIYGAAVVGAMGCASAQTPTSTSTATATATPTPTPTPTATATATTSAAPSSSPLVRMGDVASPPSFDVMTTLRDLVLPQITSCYLDAVAASPGLHGKMLVRFDVNNQGTVTSEMETKSTVSSPALSACIKSALLATVFPKPGGTATVNVPLVFRP